MEALTLHYILVVMQRCVSTIGVLIIFSGIILALYRYLYFAFNGQLMAKGASINVIRLDLGRILILGLEFIVAADLIGTTTTPDYYSLGILAIIVLVRTMLSFSISRELMYLSKEK